MVSVTGACCPLCAGMLRVLFDKEKLDTIAKVSCFRCRYREGTLVNFSGARGAELLSWSPHLLKAIALIINRPGLTPVSCCPASSESMVKARWPTAETQMLSAAHLAPSPIPQGAAFPVCSLLGGQDSGDATGKHLLLPRVPPSFTEAPVSCALQFRARAF